MKGSAAVSLTLSKEQDCGVFPYSVFRDLHQGGIYPTHRCSAENTILPLCNLHTSIKRRKKKY